METKQAEQIMISAELLNKLQVKLEEAKVPEEDSVLGVIWRDASIEFQQCIDSINKTVREGEEHIYSKEAIKRKAQAFVREKINRFDEYFCADVEKNIAQDIAAVRARWLLRRLEECKLEIRDWYAEQKLPVPAGEYFLECMDGIWVKVNFKSHQAIKSNLEEILAAYINEELLENGEYTRHYDERNFKIEYSTYLPIEHWDLSPFEEKMRSLTGTLEAWEFDIDSSDYKYFIDNYIKAVDECCNDFYKSGYMQDVAEDVFERFLEVLKEKE